MTTFKQIFSWEGDILGTIDRPFPWLNLFKIWLNWKEPKRETQSHFTDLVICKENSRESGCEYLYFWTWPSLPLRLKFEQMVDRAFPLAKNISNEWRCDQHPEAPSECSYPPRDMSDCSKYIVCSIEELKHNFRSCSSLCICLSQMYICQDHDPLEARNSLSETATFWDAQGNQRFKKYIIFVQGCQFQFNWIHGIYSDLHVM